LIYFEFSNTFAVLAAPVAIMTGFDGSWRVVTIFSFVLDFAVELINDD